MSPYAYLPMLTHLVCHHALTYQFHSIVLDAFYELAINLHRCNTQGIVYSWALPGQGGFHHVNLRSAEFLRSEFEKLGYEEDVEASKKLRAVAKKYWFKQNTHVFRRVASGGASPQRRRDDRIAKAAAYVAARGAP